MLDMAERYLLWTALVTRTFVRSALCYKATSALLPDTSRQPPIILPKDPGPALPSIAKVFPRLGDGVRKPRTDPANLPSSPDRIKARRPLPFALSNTPTPPSFNIHHFLPLSADGCYGIKSLSLWFVDRLGCCTSRRGYVAIEPSTSNGCKVLNDLLSDIYPGQGVPISPKEVVGAYSKVFCILICIGKIDFLPLFMSCDDLNDAHLPFKLHEPPTEFPVDPTSPTFFKDFCDKQWRFCPPDIDANCNRRLDQRYILPFTSKTEKFKGASSTISTIEIYPRHHFLPSLKHETNRSTTIFALKTYRGTDAEKSWNNEVRAFQKFRDPSEESPNVVGFYTAFKHGNICHAILEYADRGSLEQYLEANKPPVDGVDVARFWKRALGLIRGLKDLHNGDRIVCHQDIKPANVLVLSDPSINSPYASTFKIADLGTSHSKRITSSDDDRSSRDAQGTRTYGAPECYRSDGSLGEGCIRVTPTVDVFSLGCVLSEVTVWIAGGYEYLTGYRKARRKAIEQIPDGDCFHNGTSRLPIVEEWHRKVEAKIDSTQDAFTPKFIPMIEEMLHDQQHRGDAMSFCTKAHKIFVEALDEFLERSQDLVIPEDILSCSLRRQRGRIDPPVPPVEIDQLATTPLAVHSTSASKTTALESSLPFGRHNLVTSAPIESSTRFFDNEDMGARRHSAQPQGYQNRPKLSKTGHQISLVTNSPSTAPIASPAVEPSTCLPLEFPDITKSTYPPTNHVINRSVVRYMSRKEAISWRETKKSSWITNSTLRDQSVLNFLDNRDSVIIIDDSESMRKHWKDMAELLGIIAYMIKPHDKDGLDLYFTSSASRYHEYNSTKLVSIVEKRTSCEDMGYTDMSVRLEQVLEDYACKIQRKPMGGRTRGLNVYIFTDAIWTPLCNIVPAIHTMVKTLVANDLPEKQVGLQFISFGDDAQSLERLRLVDSFLVSKPDFPYDIVDTTPSTGNLYKMIRGAIDRNFDYDSEDQSSSVANCSFVPP
ncbi:uncharacterized protein BP5553_10446 [Venustampulla echinocandica]|uniref:Protein kinase domain-containing protein n=1 Tax=Venustampulla echinocandica TaxID=2656787 RepID=A0A370T9C8_9HELO|nr:uncharacterized protein BP5553_10446 [Venustampulla echinocandica]RDL30168.1 hypothetical protein BP5553_10446 [Venustampulla echinocandica]